MHVHPIAPGIAPESTSVMLKKSAEKSEPFFKELRSVSPLLKRGEVLKIISLPEEERGKSFISPLKATDEKAIAAAEGRKGVLL